MNWRQEQTGIHSTEILGTSTSLLTGSKLARMTDLIHKGQISNWCNFWGRKRLTTLMKKIQQNLHCLSLFKVFCQWIFQKFSNFGLLKSLMSIWINLWAEVGSTVPYFLTSCMRSPSNLINVGLKFLPWFICYWVSY